VSYIPSSSPSKAAPPNVEAPKTSFFGAFGSKNGESESKYNLNNPPQVINASSLPQAKGPVFAGAFSPAPHVNKGTQEAVRAALNTVNKIAAEPSSVTSRLPESPLVKESPHVSAFSIPQKKTIDKTKPAAGGFFTPPRTTSEKKAVKPTEEVHKANIFATVKETTNSPATKPNVFASATSSEKGAPANVNPFGSSTANVFGSSKPDATKSNFTFR
jgi:hypothetical protein